MESDVHPTSVAVGLISAEEDDKLSLLSSEQVEQGGIPVGVQPNPDLTTIAANDDVCNEVICNGFDSGRRTSSDSTTKDRGNSSGIDGVACHVRYKQNRDGSVGGTVEPSDGLTDDGLAAAASRLDFLQTFVAAVVVGTATILTVLFPNVLLAANDESDAYCSLFFTSFACWLATTFTVVVARLYKIDISFKSPIPTERIVKLGMYYGLSGLAIFYGRDRYRVLCHLQDPLAAVVLPAAVVCHLFFSSKVDGIRKLVCIAGAIVGLFICVDFQIWDEFSCHGHIITTTAADGMSWSPNEHAVWSIVYLIGLGLFALFFTLLEKTIKGDKTECEITTIPLSPREGTSANVSVIEDPTSVPYVQHSSKIPNLTFAQTLVLCMWVHLASFVTVTALFWTDLFTFLGKAGSTSAFYKMMISGFGCFIGIGDNCSNKASLAWTFVVFYCVLFVAIVYLIVVSVNCSIPYIIAVLTLALPLSTLWWSFFQTGDGFYWFPMFTGETGFAVVGFPIMITAVILYRHYANRDRICIIEA